MNKEELIRLVQRAIQTEYDGQRFYTRAAEEIKDPKGSAMFAQLAKDEVYHVEVIKNLYRELLADTDADPVKGFPIFQDRKKQEKGKPTDFKNEFEVLQRALENEAMARDFYREHARDFESKEAEEIFQDLMEMEEGHIRLLQAELDFIEQSGFWFDHMEFSLEEEQDG